jgi:hypothetical protein
MHLIIELNADQAWALAELVKRIGWSDLLALAKDDAEAALMREATCAVAAELDRLGCFPR